MKNINVKNVKKIDKNNEAIEELYKEKLKMFTARSIMFGLSEFRLMQFGYY